MTPLLHNYSKKANRTFDWDTSDNPEHFAKNMQDPVLKKKLQDLGFVDRPISYRFNSHGFRTHEFDQVFDIVCFGCSYTMGTGVYDQDTWPQQLQSMTGLVTANLGHAGSSNDTAFRFAEYYLPRLRPKVAVWLQTDRHRLELLDNHNQISLNILASDTVNPCAKDYFIKTWFSNDINQQLNLQKNTWAFKQLCAELGIKTLIMGREKVPMHGLFPYSDARDLTHPGAKDYKILAQTMADLLPL